MTFTRRRALTSSLALLTGSWIAGCTTTPPPDNPSDSPTSTVEASFFVFWDITANVTGTTATTNLLVPLGQHGHGWEPGPKIRERIHTADLFVHGMKGFQPWVDDILIDLEADANTATPLNITADIDLLTSTPDTNTVQGNPTSTHHPANNTSTHAAPNTRSNERATRPTDPHFWMDPHRVIQAVDTVRASLTSIDSTHGSIYDDNATQYQHRIEDLHAKIQTTIQNASTTALLVAGHNAFNYFTTRYDLTIYTLTNLSPDDRPTPNDIERAQRIIDTLNLTYICADPLESREAANQLVAETDAEGVLDFTAIPGLTAEWDQKNWGYIDIMENVNLPTLERALNP